MKKCPYCAEEIQDEAIKCRYCGSGLQKRAIAPADKEPPPLQLPPSNRNIAILGAAFVLVAPLIPWVHIVLIGSENLFNAGGIAPLIALAQMGAAIWLIAKIWRRGSRRLGLRLGVVIAVVDGLVLLALLHAVRHAYGFAQVGLGPWVGVGGAVVLWIGSLSMPSENVPSAASSASPTATAGGEPPHWPRPAGWTSQHDDAADVEPGVPKDSSDPVD